MSFNDRTYLNILAKESDGKGQTMPDRRLWIAFDVIAYSVRKNGSLAYNLRELELSKTGLSFMVFPIRIL